MRRTTRICAWLLLAAAVLVTHVWARGPAGATTASPQRRAESAQAVVAETVSDAATTVAVLTGTHHAATLRVAPADFSAVMGYRPRMVDGYPVNPTGGCSSPIDLPARFEILCKTHDYGYDLLRYADRRGHPLPGWARLALDRMLIDRMLVSCDDDPICLAAAELSRAGLGINTWRQYDGAPAASESYSTIAASMLTRVAAGFVGRTPEQQP